MKRVASYPWRYAAVLLLCTGILIARTPNLFGDHNLAYEDGVIFFADAFNRPPLTPLLLPYAGYWHLIPRLIAEAGSYLPLGVVPAFYAFCALVLSSVALSWFYLPHFRAVVCHDDLRLIFVLLVALLPGLNMPLWISYTQWLIALWGMLLVFMTPPRRLLVQWALALAYIAAVATAPALFVLLPLWVVRIVRTPDRRQRQWMVAIVAATLLVIGATLQAQLSEPAIATEWPRLISDLMRSIAFRMFVSPFSGYVVANNVVQTLGWPALYGLALAAVVFIGLGVASAVKGTSSSDKRLMYLAMAYIAAGTAALYARRAPFYGYLFSSNDGVPLHSVRYHFLGMCAIFLLCLMVLDHFVSEGRLRRRWIWTGALIVLLLYSPNFAVAHWPNDPSWPKVAHLLLHRIDPAAPGAVAWSAAYPLPTDAEANNGEPAVLPLSVRIMPPHWAMTLYLPPGTPQGYLFPEGPRLLSIDNQIAGDQVQIDLSWQAHGVEGYTAYVHLLDKQGMRLAGADVRLDLPSDSQRYRPLEPALQIYEPALVSSTQHVFSLPVGLEAGIYDVAIGLYTNDQGQVKPGSAVILRAQVEIGSHG